MIFWSWIEYRSIYKICYDNVKIVKKKILLFFVRFMFMLKFFLKFFEIFYFYERFFDILSLDYKEDYYIYDLCML